MAQRENCIYCNEVITERSKEHVIQNALGGLYESTDICCPKCNNYISKFIDVPFTTIFNPIISRIPNFSKTNNTKSMPGCTGKVSYNGKTYDANIKNGKVISCPELSKELRQDISKLPLEIIAYDFKLGNESFHTGIAKIAFNFAMDKNIDFKFLKSGLAVKKTNSKIESIKYNYPIIPFCPLNPIDAYLEQNTKPTLFHNMILFSQHNELWCYIDLFNTFQYYVLLSDELQGNENIYANYTQTLQKINRDTPKLNNLNDPKTVMIYAMQYGVKPTMDAAEFTRRVNNAINKESQKVSMESIFGKMIQQIPFEFMFNTPNKHLLFQAMHLYFQDDMFQEKNFRVLTPALDGNGLSVYPHELLKTISNNPKFLQQYTTMKFNKLNQFLTQTQR